MRATASVFEAGVVGRFRATHSLRGDFGPAARPHSHDYRVEATARGERLREDGTLLDLARLRGALDAALAELDGTVLDQLAAFREQNSTAEVVARHLAERLGEALGERHVRVRVWESDDAFGGCER